MVNKVEVKKGYIFIKMTGQLLLKNEKDMYKVENSLLNALNVAKERHISRLLFDGREVTGKISTNDKFYIMEFIAKENLSRFISASYPLKIAFVLSTEMESSKFGEMVGRNRGLNTLVTNDMQEAMNWLGVEEPQEVK